MNDLIKLGCIFAGTVAATFAARETARTLQIRQAKKEYAQVQENIDKMFKSMDDVVNK